MSERSGDWMIDVPATDDPEIVRTFLREARGIEPKDDNVRDAIANAERLLADLEREKRQDAA